MPAIPARPAAAVVAGGFAVLAAVRSSSSISSARTCASDSRDRRSRTDSFVIVSGNAGTAAGCCATATPQTESVAAVHTTASSATAAAPARTRSSMLLPCDAIICPREALNPLDLHVDDTSEHTELYSAIAEATSDAVIFAGRDGLIRLWNRGAELLFGYPAADVVGQSLDVIIP